MGDSNLVGHVQSLIAFDLDGTLIDSHRDLAESANQLISELGGNPLSGRRGRRHGGRGRRATRQARARRRWSRTSTGRGRSRFLEIYDTRLINHTRVYDGILDTLNLARSHASLAVLTNKPIGSNDEAARRLRDSRSVSNVIGGDGPYPRNPVRKGCCAIMATAGAPPERTLMVGDSAVDYGRRCVPPRHALHRLYGSGFAGFLEARTGLSGEWLTRWSTM